MKNRVGAYLGGIADINRASEALAFCEAIVRIHPDPHGMANWEIDSISRLQIEAVRVFRELDIPLPWERVES